MSKFIDHYKSTGQLGYVK